jgi:hypothetical protein
LFCLFIIILPGCKKYPENNLWFKKPEKVTPFIDSHLKKYSVNGIDSLDLLNYYFGHARGLVKDIRAGTFKTQRYYSHANYYLLFEPSLSLDFTYKFISNKKKIVFDMNSDTSLFKKNIFISQDVEWTIIRLKDSGPFKIETKLDNGNYYEIEIE